jgi:hypothetical protein
MLLVEYFLVIVYLSCTISKYRTPMPRRCRMWRNGSACAANLSAWGGGRRGRQDTYAMGSRGPSRAKV